MYSDCVVEVTKVEAVEESQWLSVCGVSIEVKSKEWGVMDLLCGRGDKDRRKECWTMRI